MTKKIAENTTNGNILSKIFRTLRSQLFWAIIGVLVAVIFGAPIIIDKVKSRPNLLCRVGEVTITNSTLYNVYTFVPKDLYNAGLGGAILISWYNAGNKELNNVTAIIETKSLSIEKQQEKLVNKDENLSVKERFAGRFDPRTNYEDAVTGYRIFYSTNGYKDRVDCVYRNVPAGLEVRAPIYYHYDKNTYINYGEIMKIPGVLPRENGILLDEMSLKLSYGANDIPMTTIRELGVITWEYMEIDELVNNWRKHGSFCSLSYHWPEDYDEKYFSYIFVFPKVIIIDGKKNLSYEDADYYSVEISNPLKCNLTRKCRIRNEKTGMTTNCVQKDTPDQAEEIKNNLRIHRTHASTQ